MDVQDIADAIAATLTGMELNALPYLSDVFNAPAVLVAPEIVEFHLSMGSGPGDSGLSKQSFTVHLILSRADDQTALKSLAAYMSKDGATSIRAFLESSPLIVDEIEVAMQVVRAGPPVSLNVNGTSYIDCPFAVEVYAN